MNPILTPLNSKHSFYTSALFKPHGGCFDEKNTVLGKLFSVSDNDDV